MPANIIGASIDLILGAVGGYFLIRFLADKLNLRGWKRTVFIAGITTVISAVSAVIGYFIGPYVQKAGQALLSGLKKLFTNKIGTQVGNLGTITKNTKPIIKGITNHGALRMAERDITKEVAQVIINKGIAIAQSGGKVLYLTKTGVVVLNDVGEIVIAYGSDQFDDTMRAIIELLF